MTRPRFLRSIARRDLAQADKIGSVVVGARVLHYGQIADFAIVPLEAMNFLVHFKGGFRE
jgi:hypothetical protein